MSLQPDAGMSALAADLARRNQQAAQAAAQAPPDGDGGAELEIYARLTAALNGNTAEIRAARTRPSIPWEYCHPITLAPAQIAAAGVIDDPDRWGPKAGWSWHVTGLTVSLGTATQWSIYQDAAQPTNLRMQNTVSGLWEPKGWFLLPNQRIVYAGTGGGITVAIGTAIEINLDWLATYLM